MIATVRRIEGRRIGRFQTRDDAVPDIMLPDSDCIEGRGRRIVVLRDLPVLTASGDKRLLAGLFLKLAGIFCACGPLAMPFPALVLGECRNGMAV